MEFLNDIGVNHVYPEGAFYLYVYVNQDSVTLAEELLKKKLLVMPSKLFGDEHNAIRISYAIDEKKLEKGLEILTKKLKQKS